MQSFFFGTLRRLEVTRTAGSHFHMSRSRRWTKNTAARKQARALLHASSMSKMDGNLGEKTDYSAWSQEKLIERVTQLEAELEAQNRRFFLLSRIQDVKSNLNTA
jgi:hypothetical protein